MPRARDRGPLLCGADRDRLGRRDAGQSLVADLKSSGKPAPWNVGLFAGAPDDNNATFFVNGEMKVPQPGQ